MILILYIKNSHQEKIAQNTTYEGFFSLIFNQKNIN